MATGRGTHSVAAVAATLSALLWAGYYFLVLGATPSAGAGALLAFPFLAGGSIYAALAFAEGNGRAFLRLWTSPSAYVRTALALGMQVSVLASTYVAGTVNTSLLSLLGDVALTPLLLMALYAEGRDRARSVPFLLGLLLSAGGAALTILGGKSAPGLVGWAWLVAPAVPLTVAFYFLATARENRRLPQSAVVGQSMLGAGLLALPVAGLFPGGFGSLAVGGGLPWVLILALGATSFFLAPWLYFRAIGLAGILLPALLMSGIPVFTLLLTVVLYRTAPSPIGLVGIPVAVAGALLALEGTRPPPALVVASAGAEPG